MERLKQMGLECCRYARTIVSDGNRTLLAAARNGNRDMTALREGFDRIFNLF